MNQYKGLQPKLQLTLIPIRDWNLRFLNSFELAVLLQLTLIPIRDWNISKGRGKLIPNSLQLTLIPIRDWNGLEFLEALEKLKVATNINPYQGLKHPSIIKIRRSMKLQLTLIPIRDWNSHRGGLRWRRQPLQLTLIPIRDWNPLYL